jgi:hypothetical protein
MLRIERNTRTPVLSNAGYELHHTAIDLWEIRLQAAGAEESGIATSRGSMFLTGLI